MVRRRQAQSELQLRRSPLNGPRRDKTAIIWEGEPGEIRRLTLLNCTTKCKFANALKALGIKKGDRVAIYMGMTPELAIALLACARIGAIHSVIFGGFAASAIADRVNDSACVAILPRTPVTAAAMRSRSSAPWTRPCTAAPPSNTSSSTAAPARHQMVAGRDHWWHDLWQMRPRMPRRAARFRRPALHPLHLRHHRQAQRPGPHHRRLCRANLPHLASTSLTCAMKTSTGARRTLAGSPATPTWSTARSKTAPPSLMYEGAPNWPDFSRFWKIVDDHQVTVFYTAPTVVRAFIEWRDQTSSSTTSSSLRLRAPSASPSIPKPGSGIARRSATTAAASPRTAYSATGAIKQYDQSSGTT